MPHSTMSPPPASAADSEPNHREDAIMTSIDTDKDDTEQVDRVRVKNRRKRYLDLNPDYFTSAELELAGRW